jgi:hypothetical protein
MTKRRLAAFQAIEIVARVASGAGGRIDGSTISPSRSRSARIASSICSSNGDSQAGSPSGGSQSDRAPRRRATIRASSSRPKPNCRRSSALAKSLAASSTVRCIFFSARRQ